jgi:hypothetical protein
MPDAINPIEIDRPIMVQVLLRHIIHEKFWSQFAGSHLHQNQDVDYPSLEAPCEPRPILLQKQSYS